MTTSSFRNYHTKGRLDHQSHLHQEQANGSRHPAAIALCVHACDTYDISSTVYQLYTGRQAGSEMTVTAYLPAHSHTAIHVFQGVSKSPE